MNSNIRIVEIKMSKLLQGLRVAAWGVAWLILGSFTLESFSLYAAGAATVELLYMGYKHARIKYMEYKFDQALNYYKLDGKNIVPCTRDESVACLKAFHDSVELEEQVTQSQELNNFDVTIPNQLRHKHIGPICMHAQFTGCARKDDPNQATYKLTIKHDPSETILGGERFSTWELLMSEFDKAAAEAKRALEAAQQHRSSDKPPTIH